MHHFHPDVHSTLGIIYIVYGLLKLFMSCVALIVPKSAVANVPVLSFLASDDVTLAGQAYEYIFLIFAIYAIMFGLALLHALPEPLMPFFRHPNAELIVLTSLGLFLVIFYSFVLFTSQTIISHDPRYRHKYITLGFGAGIFFIIFGILWEALMHLLPTVRGMNVYFGTAVIVAVVIVFALLAYLIQYIASLYSERSRIDAIQVASSCKQHCPKEPDQTLNPAS